MAGCRSPSLLFAPEGLAGASPHPELSGLLSRIATYDSKVDPVVIDDAYGVACDAHAAQKRDNGEPYITHPLAVATILAGYRLDVVLHRHRLAA